MNEQDFDREKLESLRLAFRKKAQEFIDEVLGTRKKIEALQKKLTHVHYMRVMVTEEIKAYEACLESPNDPTFAHPLLMLAHAYRTIERIRAEAVLLEEEIGRLTGNLEKACQEIVD